MEGGKPLARLQRENKALLKVAYAAARLRRIGRACENVEESDAAFRKANPDASRSATAAVMCEVAFQTAMQEFDQAMMEAAEVLSVDIDDEYMEGLRIA